MGRAAAELRVRSRNARPPGMNSSAWAGRSAPPDSTRLMTGSRFWRAMSEARAPFRKEKGFMAPPRTVGSWAEIRHSTPSTTPIPTIDDAPTVYSVPHAARGPSSRKAVSAVEEQLDPLAGQAACPGRGGAARSARRRRPGPRPAARSPRPPPLRGRARLARKVGEFGSMVVVRVGMEWVRDRWVQVVGVVSGCGVRHRGRRVALLPPTWEE